MFYLHSYFSIPETKCSILNKLYLLKQAQLVNNTSNSKINFIGKTLKWAEFIKIPCDEISHIPHAQFSDFLFHTSILANSASV